MQPPRPIFLFTDFGGSGPYVGQLNAAILDVDPRCVVVDLMHDAPAMRPDLAAYLLPAVCRPLPAQAVVVAVVDPGVGGERAPLVVETGSVTLVGPDNGLLSRFTDIRRVAAIDWRPRSLSASFHGRDLFAPVAARLALARTVPTTPVDVAAMVGADWAGDDARVVYIDHYGNLMTGLAGNAIDPGRRLLAAGHEIPFAETFCRVPPGQVFWYRNSQGLVEIAANAASAATILSLAPGDEILLN